MTIHWFVPVLRKALVSSGLLIALLGTAPATLASTPADLKKAAFLQMLVNENPGVSLLGARSIGHFYAYDTTLTDFIAEQLLQAVTPDMSKPTMQRVNWYVVVLGEIGNPRYVDTLTQVRQGLTHPAMLKRVDAALASIGDRQAEPYVAGGVDLGAARKTFEQGSRARTEHPAFSSIMPNQSLTDTLTAVGLPNEMSTLTVRIARGRGTKLVFHYANAGSLMLDLQRGTPEWWTVIEAIDEALPVSTLYQGKNPGMAQMIGSLRGGMFRDFVQFRSAAIKQDPALVPLIAKRLETFSFPADRFEDDAHARLLRYIAERAVTDPEMMKSLRLIAETNVGKKTKGHAQTYLKRIEQGKMQARLPEEEKADEDDEEASEE
jgi:hypothetical protein